MKKNFSIIKYINSDEEEVIDIYRHLSGKNKCLIRRTIKNLDTFYSYDPYLQGYFWTDSKVKIICYTHEESDLINSFRALNENQRKELLNAMHIQITSYPLNYSTLAKLTLKEKKFLNYYRELSKKNKKLINEEIKMLLDTTPDEQSAGASPTRRVSITPLEDEMLYTFREFGRQQGEDAQRTLIAVAQKMV